MNDEIMNVPCNNFQFSAVKPEMLDSTEYTLVTIAVDQSGSVSSFQTELTEMLKSVIKACKLNPRVQNILVRLVTFNDLVCEVFGFKPLAEIDENSNLLTASTGCTALNDAVYTSLYATVKYSEILLNQDYSVNGIMYIITDGCDNRSIYKADEILKVKNDLNKKEILNKIVSILIGVNISECKNELDEFKAESGLDKFIDAGNATTKELAKLGEFISKSISSSSQALNSGAGNVNVNSITF